MSPQASSERRERAQRNGQVRPEALERALWESQLLGRLRVAAGNRKLSTIAALTGVHPETVRRYMTYGRPSLYFVVAMSRALEVPLDWLIHGTVEVEDDPTPVRIARNAVSAPAKPGLRITTASATLSRGAGAGRTRKVLGSR